GLYRYEEIDDTIKGIKNRIFSDYCFWDGTPLRASGGGSFFMSNRCCRIALYLQPHGEDSGSRFRSETYRPGRHRSTADYRQWTRYGRDRQGIGLPAELPQSGIG